MGVYIPDKLIEELRNNPMDAWDLLEHDDAVTVKPPHGRLIDEDKIYHGWEKVVYDSDFEKAPTVIESEVE